MDPDPALGGRRCGRHALRLNQACLRVRAPSLSDALTLEAQSAECVGCPLWTVFDGPERFPANRVVVNTSFPTRMRLRDQFRDCHVDYHFGEFGEYALELPPADDGDGGQERPCVLTETSPPVHSLMFVLYTFLAVVLLRLLWLGGRCVVRTRFVRSRWMFYRHGVSLDVQDDLGDDHRRIVPSRSGSSEDEDTPTAVEDEASTSNENEALVPAPAPRVRTRVRSVDVLRGISIAVMIFVNYGGGDYWFFRHSPWNGLTVADLVFPWFMFVMGTSLVFSVNSQLRRGATRRVLFLAAVRRSAALFFLGIFVNTGGKRDLPIRIPGVLQRFSLSYLIVASIEILCTHREHQEPSTSLSKAMKDIRESVWQILAMLCLIAAHSLLTFLLPVPGCPTGYLGPGGLHDGAKFFDCTGGAAGFIDRTVFGSHMYARPTSAKIYDSTVAYDPEGLLGVLTSSAIVLLGCQAARVMLVHPSWTQRTTRWAVWAVVLGLVAGALCGFSKEGGVIPVNKNLWSVSFILAMASMAYILLIILYICVDVFNLWFGGPFVYAGMNPILLYLGHEVCRGHFPFEWKPYTQTHLEIVIMNTWATLLWLLLSYCLYKRKIFLSL